MNIEDHINNRTTAFIPWMRSAFIHWALIFGSFILLVRVFQFAERNNFGIIPSAYLILTFFVVWFFVGSRQHALSILGHDGGHGLVHQNLFINDLLTKILAFLPFGVSLAHYRQFHFAHHKHLSTPLDPELLLKRNARPAYDLPIGGITSIVLRSMKDMLGLGSGELFDLVKHSALPVNWKEWVEVLSWWSGVLSIALYMHVPYLLPFVVFWIFCLGTSFWTCFRLRIFIEHLGTKGIHRVRPSLIARHILYPYNTWYHFEHHAFSSVSATQLPPIRKQLSPEVPEMRVLDIYQLYINSPEIVSGTPLNEEPVT